MRHPPLMGCYRPAARRAASSICAMPKTRTIAAMVVVSVAGSVTVGCGGHLINMAAGVSGGWTSSTTRRSDRLTDPAARNLPESLPRELSVRPMSPTRLSFPQMEIICPLSDRKPSNLSNSLWWLWTIAGPLDGQLPKAGWSYEACQHFLILEPGEGKPQIFHLASMTMRIWRRQQSMPLGASDRERAGDEDESVAALVGREPDKPVYAARASQSLELVLASVL